MHINEFGEAEYEHTNNHGGELETLADAFAMYLVGQVGEADIASELFSDSTTVGNAT